MKRHLSNLARALAVLLCVVIALLSVVSVNRSLRYEWGKDQRYCIVGFSGGGAFVRSGGTTHDAVQYDLDGGGSLGNPDDDLSARQHGRSISDYDWRALGFEWIHWSPNPDGVSAFEFGNAVYIPAWFVIVVAAGIAGLVIVRGWRRDEREILHKCTACGYDLRATPQRCPECGATYAIAQA